MSQLVYMQVFHSRFEQKYRVPEPRRIYFRVDALGQTNSFERDSSRNSRSITRPNRMPNLQAADARCDSSMGKNSWQWFCLIYQNRLHRAYRSSLKRLYHLWNQHAELGLRKTLALLRQNRYELRNCFKTSAQFSFRSHCCLWLPTGGHRESGECMEKAIIRSQISETHTTRCGGFEFAWVREDSDMGLGGIQWVLCSVFKHNDDFDFQWFRLYPHSIDDECNIERCVGLLLWNEG